LVEDDLDIQIVARMALSEIGGYEVEVCASGKEALDRVIGLRPQLILLDVMMPDLDGLGTLKAFRRLPQLAEVPVVFMTAKAQPDELREYHQAGAADVIVKPFDPMAISEIVAGIWRRYSSRG
jgi:CheY-like chemotaxis protein